MMMSRGKVKVEKATMGVMLPELTIVDSTLNIAPIKGDTIPGKQTIKANPVKRKKKIRCNIEKSIRDSTEQIFMGDVQIIEERK